IAKLPNRAPIRCISTARSGRRRAPDGALTTAPVHHQARAARSRLAACQDLAAHFVSADIPEPRAGNLSRHGAVRAAIWAECAPTVLKEVTNDGLRSPGRAEPGAGESRPR